jgi:capsular exopolysaccharide synthesis family protein
VAAAVALGGMYVVVAPNTYTSTAQIDINLSQRGAVGDTPSQTETPDFYSSYLNTQCQLIVSTPVLAIALAQPSISDSRTLRGVTDKIEWLQKYLTVEVSKRSNLIDVSLEAHNSSEAAQIVNAVVHAYISYETKTQFSSSTQALDILQSSEARDEAAIAGANAQLAALRDQYGTMAYESDQSNPLLQQEAALSNALTAARLESVEAKAAYDQAMEMMATDPVKKQLILEPDDAGDLAAASAAQLDLLRAEMFRLQETMKDMERTYMPDHPIVLQARSRLNQLTVSYIRAQRQRYLAAKAQEDALQNSFDQQHKIVLAQATRAADFDQVKNKLARLEKHLDIVEGQINQVSVVGEAGGLSINIVPAEPTLKRSHPSGMVALGSSLLTGLLVGGGLAIAKEKKLFEPREADEPSDELGLPVLGVMPRMEEESTTLAERALRSHLEPQGAVANASMGILRSLGSAGFNEQSGRTLLVTSTNPHDGRTTVATNLAIAMAQSGLRVLLVDATLRAPRLHAIFRVNNALGLFDVLSGESQDHPAICATTVQGVEVIPCGVVPVNAVEKLNSESLVDLLGELSDRYDRVIVDSPALSRGVEARILAASCAASILVTGSRPSGRRQLAQGLSLLHSVVANVLGIVINEPEPADPLKTLSSDTHSLKPPGDAGKSLTLPQSVASAVGN